MIPYFLTRGHKQGHVNPKFLSVRRQYLEKLLNVWTSNFTHVFTLELSN